MNSRYLLVVLGAGAALWAARRWRQAIPVTLVLLIVEGGIRKWLLPGAQDLVYFAKDVLLLGCYIGFLGAIGRKHYPLPAMPAVYIGLVLGALYGVIEVFNPNLPSVLVGAFGFKAYFFYAPLIAVVPAAFQTPRELAQFLYRYSLIAIPLAALAVVQFLAPGTSPLNAYARSGEEMQVATFGATSAVRVTGTFSYITGYVAYLFANAMLILAILGARRWVLRGNVLVFSALAATILGMLLSGSRGPIVALAAVLPFYWWLLATREKEGSVILGRVLLISTAIALFLAYGATDVVEAFYGRLMTTGDTADRILSPLRQPIQALPHAGLLGYGIGATHQAATALTGGLNPAMWLSGLIVEGEAGRVMLELGLLGFILVYFVRIALVVVAYRQAKSLVMPFHRAVAATCFLFFLAHLPTGMVFNVTADVYYWFFAGLLTCVMKFDHQLLVGGPRPRPQAPAARRRSALISPSQRILRMPR